MVRIKYHRRIIALKFLAIAVVGVFPVGLTAQIRPNTRLPSPGKQATPETRPTPYFAPTEKIPVKEVRIVGNRRFTEAEIRSMLKTRENRTYDPEIVQDDVRSLLRKGFSLVRPREENVPGGVILTFEVMERPVIEHIRFVGNKKVKDKHLKRESGLEVDDSLNVYSVDEARRKLEEYYLERGFTKARITILEGDKPKDRGVAFRIDEGPQQRVWKVKFEGNSFARDGRLKTQIKSKPGLLWMFKGKVNYQAIEEDKARLISYYRTFGFFSATVQEDLRFDKDDEWLTITFHINEGPRYQVQNIQFVGNEKYATEDLMRLLELKSGDPFNSGKLREDEDMIRDLYGGEGHIASEINAELRLWPEPGKLDLVYNISEGDQYRVGRIFVNIEGDHPHTRKTVVLNRLSIKPNDIININEIRASERRLKSAQLFNDPQRGIFPSIAIKPPEVGEDTTLARPDAGRRRSTFFRGQSPGKRWQLILGEPVHQRPRGRIQYADVYIDVQSEKESTW